MYEGRIAPIWLEILNHAGALCFDEDTMKISERWAQIVVWGLCVVLAVALCGIVRHDRKRTAERAVQLQQQADQVQQTDGEKREILLAIYEKYYTQMNVPGMVCWGDGAMVGSKDRSLSISLEKAISDNLFSSLTKRLSRVLDDEEYTLPSVTLHNMGVSNEEMRQILVRAGVNKLEIGDWTMIPSDTDPVTVRLMDEEAHANGGELRFAKQKDVNFGQVWIDDIEGTLVTTDDWYDSNHPRFAFVRDEKGNAEEVGAGTEVELESAEKYLGEVPIFFFENDSGRSIDGFVSDVENLVNRYADTEGDEDEDEISYELPYVVVFTTDEGSDMDRAMSEAFKSHYIRNDGYAAEMTEKTYNELAQKVYENLDVQGCFDEVKGLIEAAVKEAGEM